ncbi:MAG: AMP-dependent synthetase, partial [Sulfobacillus sp.]|nr:AMP-dependent synthetase [Sulfobacillus sp.]
DRPEPYHYAGMGLLVEGLALTDRIPLLAESRHWTLVSRVYEVPHMLVWVLIQLARGGSLTLLPDGIPIEPRGIIADGPWMIPASIYEDTPDDWLERSPSGRIIIGPLAPHLTMEDSGTVSLWGPGQEGLPRWIKAEEPLLDDPGPGADLTAASAELSTVPPTVFSLSNPPASVLAVPTRSERGNRLWVKSSREIADDTYQQLLAPFEQEGWMPIRVAQWPITREGHIDTRVLQQLADGDPLIDISRLRNVGVIPALVQSLALAPSVPN